MIARWPRTEALHARVPTSGKEPAGGLFVINLHQLCTIMSALSEAVIDYETDRFDIIMRRVAKSLFGE